jgi:hypothetical protein
MVGKCSRHGVYEKCAVQEAEVSMRKAWWNVCGDEDWFHLAQDTVQWTG